MNLIRLLKQVLQLLAVWQLQPLSLMDVALVLIRIVETNQIRVS